LSASRTRREKSMEISSGIPWGSSLPIADLFLVRPALNGLLVHDTGWVSKLESHSCDSRTNANVALLPVRKPQSQVYKN
jgi:hypothetical protein